MRLADFILGNIEPILAEWEVFARGIQPGATMDKLALRDHAEEILRATARDMVSAQTAAQQSSKSKGTQDAASVSAQLNGASDDHAVGRVESGFDLMAVVAEYRALRASVIRLWRNDAATLHTTDLEDLTRFNESIDQSLAKAVRSFTQRIDRSRQMFLAILGHDLRNPLHALMMSAQVLSRSSRQDAESREMAAQISTSASAMAKMINDLLDFTGAGLGSAMPVSTARMDLERVCREVVDEMRAAYPPRTVRFESRGDLTGYWDAARLRQVVSNLLGNAIQHGALDGPVDITLNGERDNVVLVVHNGGAPIPADALATIFDPLVRGLSAELQRQRRPGSIGLGLYIARAVVVAHGGSIEVTSTATAGTAFTVRLPRGGANQPTKARSAALG